jgi:hypothetical protein
MSTKIIAVRIRVWAHFDQFWLFELIQALPVIFHIRFLMRFTFRTRLCSRRYEKIIIGRASDSRGKFWALISACVFSLVIIYNLSFCFVYYVAQFKENKRTFGRILICRRFLPSFNRLFIFQEHASKKRFFPGFF